MSILSLKAEIEIPVRFSEVDSLGIVWHGNYVQYMEDGREAFGKKYDLKYLDIYGNGYFTPIVKLVCDYKYSLNYGDTAIVETIYTDSEAAKIQFDYNIYRKSNHELVATGKTVQVFLNTSRELMLNIPPFFAEWKKKRGIL
jgi:acyl-CoA thioester hydrolase